jgi:hypothetical protein
MTITHKQIQAEVTHKLQVVTHQQQRTPILVAKPTQQQAQLLQLQMGQM